MIKLKSVLMEDVEERKLFRDQARMVWNDFIKYIKSGGDFRAGWYGDDNVIDPESSSFGISTEIGDISPYLDDQLVIVLFTSHFADGKYNDENNTLRIGALPPDEVSKYYKQGKDQFKIGDQINYTKLVKFIKDQIKPDLANYLGEEEKDIFFHEYTHYIDLRYKQAVKNYDNPVDNFVKYFNDPIETNARFQSALTKFEYDLNNRNVHKNFKNFREFQKWFFEKYENELGMNSQFIKTKDWVLKSFRKRLYKHWDKIMRDINEV